MSQLPVEEQRRESLIEASRVINNLDALPAWVLVCTLDGTIELVNAAVTRLLGYGASELVGQSWPYPWLSGPWSEEDRDPFDELRRTGAVAEFEATCRSAQGQLLTLSFNLSLQLDDAGAPHRALLVGWDLTQRKSKEADLSQAQKIQAVSQLASGVAHDINNNLAVILGYAEFLLSTSESFGDIVRQALAAIQEQSIDCANTVRRIQLFSRAVSPSQFSTVSVNDVLLDVAESLLPGGQLRNATGTRQVRFQSRLADLPPVYAYHTGLREALLGVMTNAVEALPQGGTVTANTRYEDGQVVIEIQDNGLGVSALNLNRVFDAFFTSKGPSKSGLGLSIAYNLITQQGGTIGVDSREGHGTTCTIKIPASPERSAPAILLADLAGPNALSVLVVDDEPLVADVFRTFLESSGHRAVTCLNGTYALQIFQEDDFDLAVVDLGMPNMDGWEFSRRIHNISPSFPIIVATGWNVSLEDGSDQGVEVQAVLKKPFGMRDLTQAIDQAMEARRTG